MAFESNSHTRIQHSALGSLTATYTDSEGEDEGTVREEQNSSSDKEKENYTPKSSPKVIVNEIGVPRQPVAKLVSYNDDLVVSDEDEVHETDTTKSSIDPILEGDDDVQLPPEPNGRCSNELQDKIARLHERMLSSGLDMNYVIQQRKDFRNPSIYEKLIQYCELNEFGTNFSPAVYDPLSWGKESYYEELDKAQRAEMARREKERKEKTKVEFVVGTAKRSGGSNPGSGAEDDSKRRKSKWDQVGNNIAALQAVRPATLLQQSSLTTSATGTKSTVISAFGSLPKKPKF